MYIYIYIHICIYIDLYLQYMFDIKCRAKSLDLELPDALPRGSPGGTGPVWGANGVRVLMSWMCLKIGLYTV